MPPTRSILRRGKPLWSENTIYFYTSVCVFINYKSISVSNSVFFFFLLVFLNGTRLNQHQRHACVVNYALQSYSYWTGTDYSWNVDQSVALKEVTNQISLRLAFTGLRLLKTFCPHHTTCGRSRRLVHKGKRIVPSALSRWRFETMHVFKSTPRSCQSWAFQ